MTLPYKDAPARQALCMRHKNVGGHGFVSREAWASETPYLTCDRMNPRGTCPLFERKRDGQIEMET
jgi:hypothetical protein